MGKFNRGGGSGGFGGGDRGGFRGGDRGGRPSFQKKSWGGDRGGDRGEKEMFGAVCAECNKDCQVPFRPSGEKPVYCSDCFRKEENGGGGREQRGSFGGGRDFGRGGERSFDRGSERQSFAKPASADNDGLKKQLSEMNTKLDRLVSAIEGMTKTKTTVSEAPKAEVKASKKPEAMKIEVVNKSEKKEVSKKPAKKTNSKGKK